MTANHQELGDGITLIETHYQRPGLACCYLLCQGDEVALIDTGTAYTVPGILELLQQRGIAPEQVRYVVPTHVHLDHAGGAGQLMAALPEARLLVHPRGARHLVDPTRLRAGTVEVYGEATFRKEYGELLPVPAERVIEAEDGHRFELEGRTLTCLDTPGHARHHICIWDPQSGGFFSGDTFGISYPELETGQGPFMLLPSTPVQFDPGSWHGTLERLLGYQPQRMYLTHYGEVRQPSRLAPTLHRELDAYAAMAEAAADDEQPLDAIGRQLEAHIHRRLQEAGTTLDPETLDYLLGMDIRICAQGLAVWLQRRRQ